MQRGPTREVGRKHSIRKLLIDLDRLHGRIGIRETLRLVSPNGGQDCHQVGAREQGWGATEVQRRPHGDAGDARQSVENRSSREIVPAETRRAERGPLRVQSEEIRRFTIFRAWGRGQPFVTGLMMSIATRGW